MKKYVLYALMIILTHSVSGQSLGQKWEKVVQEAENYQNYKVIKKTELNDLWKVISDSLAKSKSDLASEKSLVLNQSNEISQLQKETAELKSNLDIAIAAKDGISFLGMTINKYTYATILWCLFAIACGGCAFLYFQFHNSNKVTVQKIGEYDELFNNFEEYKKNAIEKERKLKRDLQTYMNTIEDMKKTRTSR
ncbi:hypothetical protein [Sporocytophaga myxococcoides]|uniref:hypothetical protein n=1 Tax=Sporocytophaga myxococcoides TaxID=153721 RepID=UPI00049203AC|nr:hypothetical protein [Sporocytophaga myxococcoides]